MKTSLILLISIFLIGCNPKGFPAFPIIDYIYEVDTDHHVCARFKVVSYQPFNIKWDEDFPIDTCNAMVGIKPIDMQAIIAFKSDAEKWAREHQTCFK